MDTLPPDHIRLLLIEPAGSGAGAGAPADSPIRCRMLNTSLESAPPYEALSYTWGSIAQDRTILVDGEPVSITRNLHDAVRQLRGPAEARLMWIDMVCIRQSDHRERSEQVGIMKHIFRRAVRVVVWLGASSSGASGSGGTAAPGAGKGEGDDWGEDEDEDEDDTAKAFELLAIFEAHYRKYNTCDVGWGISQGDLPPLVGDRRWVALARLFKRPWFSRSWVIQEIAMAREITVACGSFSCEWDVVSNTAQALRRYGRIGPFTSSYAVGVMATFIMSLLRDAQNAHNTNWTLMALLRLTRRFEATDDRDKVFAVVGMVVGDYSPESLGAAVDYGLTAAEVFTRVAAHQLEANRNVELLANAGIAQKIKVPTWVPDWSFSHARGVIAGVGNAAAMCAASAADPIFSLSPDKSVLKIRGAIFDAITHLQKETELRNPIFDMSSDDKLRRSMASGKAAVFGCVALSEPAFTFPEGQSREESLWRTLCCNLTADIIIRRAPPEWAVGWKMLLRQYACASDAGEIDLDRLSEEFKRDFAEGDLDHFSALARSMEGHGRGRTLCVTETGRLCYAPNASEVGDKICLVYGSKVPFVIRESESSVDPYNDNDNDKDNNNNKSNINDNDHDNEDQQEPLFKLVGECYVHGVMDGELMKDEGKNFIDGLMARDLSFE